MYMNCELNDAEIWLKSALQQEPGKEVMMLPSLFCTSQIGLQLSTSDTGCIVYVFNKVSGVSELL
jgi:hypothetical protein